MSVDSLVCVHTKEEGSRVGFPEFKRSRIDEVCSATDDVGDDAPSRYKLAIRRKPKQEHWWDFGMVFSSISTEEVTVDLMNIEECLIDRRVATLHESMGIGMSFALPLWWTRRPSDIRRSWTRSLPQPRTWIPIKRQWSLT
ncbi:unnamed protein product [Linum tenue]|uniref:Uncharacterized protein n=1 Tax=Linum tenue TaxID=586396 RepID=A0AAV0IT92_9ROSI|nr:unnamed protein product [Linum tenue]